ncbi:MAG: hypothetical protein WCW67_07520 [Candidatus Margulisiibacteriota bacterium]|jgi:hypothetical protein
MKRASSKPGRLWEKIEPFRHLSAEAKLTWLEEAKRFVLAFVPSDKRITPREMVDRRSDAMKVSTEALKK